jgi:hypothetical protein
VIVFILVVVVVVVAVVVTHLETLPGSNDLTLSGRNVVCSTAGMCDVVLCVWLFPVSYCVVVVLRDHRVLFAGLRDSDQDGAGECPRVGVSWLIGAFRNAAIFRECPVIRRGVERGQDEMKSLVRRVVRAGCGAQVAVCRLSCLW